MSLTYHQLRALQYRSTAESYRHAAKAEEFEARIHQLDIKGTGGASTKAELDLRECLRRNGVLWKLAEDYERMAVSVEAEGMRMENEKRKLEQV